jgi:hypothetical protein
LRVACVALLLASLLAVSPAAAAAGTAAAGADGPNPCVGTMTEQPDEATIVSIQGAQVTPDGYRKRPALLVSFAPDGEFRWVHNASANGRWWAYDVDRLSNGNLLFETTDADLTVVGELDPEADEYVWTERFDGRPDDPEDPEVVDAHDADLIHGDELVVADKGEGHERLLVYNRTQGRVTWEWRFEDSDAFPESGGGPPDDWTHVNDVDTINVSESDLAEGSGEWFVASVRNFDQVAFINRSSGALELTLGADGDHDVLHRQHNPDHLWGPNGEHTLLVADSRNDRVVEYEYDHEAETWERVWTVTGLNEPRDADRLPNGNTLISDRMGHRVVEVTPDGEVVWEVYTPYETYDAERGGPGSEGPTMREYGASGSPEVQGDAEFSDEEVAACAEALYGFAPSQLEDIAGDLTGKETHRGEEVPLLPVAAGVLLVSAVAIAAGFRYR